jgi:hypothetical protein
MLKVCHTFASAYAVMACTGAVLLLLYLIIIIIIIIITTIM